jgi:hypothetical protein
VGFLLWIIPGLVLVSVLYVAVPAAVIERAGVAAAIQRSAQLTQGNRIGVFSLNAIFFLMAYGAARLLMEAAADGGSIFWTGHVAISTALGSFGAVAMTVTYQQLRQLKDGRTPEQSADVFK